MKCVFRYEGASSRELAIHHGFVGCIGSKTSCYVRNLEPDITGNYAATDWFRDISKITTSGALFNDTSKGSRSQTGASGYTGSQTVGFQAAKSNATFGKSSIVQPKTFYTLMIVKV